MPGEATCGDVAVVQTHARGYLLAAIDGVGHGSAAATAAQIAAGVLRANAARPVVPLVQCCHEALRATRGVAMSLASVDAESGRLAWVGVGNIQGTLQRRGRGAARAPEVLLQRSGLVGCNLPALQASTLALQDGDVLGLATDGIHESFCERVLDCGTPQSVADTTLAALGRITDDALVIVAHIAVPSR
jgi:hypothetical protein